MLKRGVRDSGSWLNRFRSWHPTLLILSLIINLSCLSDTETTPRTPGVPEKSLLFTCAGNYSVRTGSGSLHNAFFIGTSELNYFSMWQSHLYKYELKTMNQISDRSFIPQEITLSYYAQRDSLTGWLLTQTADGKWTAHVVDTLGNSKLSAPIEPDKNDNNGYVLATTPDFGFVLVANPGTVVNTSTYTVHRYNDQGQLMWKKTQTHQGRINSAIALRDGGYLLGGTQYNGTLRNSFLAKLDDSGNERWNESKHAGNASNSFSIDYLIEADSGDYYLLLYNKGNSLSLLRSDTAYNLKWSRPIEYKPVFYLPAMQQVGKNVLVYYSSGTGLAGTFNIGFSSVRYDGTINWVKIYGGTGDETVFAMRFISKIGYYLVGSTENYDGISATPINSSYIIKTNLEGQSCK